MAEEISVSPYAYLEKDYFEKNAAEYKRLVGRRQQKTLDKSDEYFEGIKKGIQNYYRRPKDAYNPQLAKVVRENIYSSYLESFRRKFDAYIRQAKTKGVEWVFFKNFKEENGVENDILSYALRHNIFGMGDFGKSWYTPYINFFAQGKSKEQLNNLLFFIGSEKKVLTAINSLAGAGADLRFVEPTTGNTALMAFFEHPKKTVWISSKDEQTGQGQKYSLVDLFKRSFLAARPQPKEGCFYFPRNQQGKNIFDMLLQNGYVEELSSLCGLCVSYLKDLSKEWPDEFQASAFQVKEALPLSYMMLYLLDNMKSEKREAATESLYLLQMAVNGSFRKIRLAQGEETEQGFWVKDPLPSHLVMLSRVCDIHCWEDLQGYAPLHKDGDQIMQIWEKSQKMLKAAKKMSRAREKTAEQSEQSLLPEFTESAELSTQQALAEQTNSVKKENSAEKKNPAEQAGTQTVSAPSEKNGTSSDLPQKTQEKDEQPWLFSKEELALCQIISEALSNTNND